ncbi:MAG: DUF2721 domain-containing protein [Rhodocyclaceae bacterium]|jgi:hypothetical protein|nr:DUF2721 domain-containing protein [Rhodocyclaceae bacterium]MCA4903814.1 DUF2721 domain-containing protein [Rhodocyclaceae bacterium]
MITDGISHAIQLAVAPVFMLTAIAGLIGALATRLGRIIDRARNLEERIREGRLVDQPAVEATYLELRRLKVRGRVVNASVGLLALAAMMIGATVLSLFLGETTDSRISPLVSITFLSGVVCFVLALVGFLLETLLAGYTLRFRDQPPLD